MEPPGAGGSAAVPLTEASSGAAVLKKAQRRITYIVRTIFAFLRMIPTHQVCVRLQDPLDHTPRPVSVIDTTRLMPPPAFLPTGASYQGPCSRLFRVRVQLVRQLRECGPSCAAKVEASLNAGLVNSLRADMEALQRSGSYDFHPFPPVPTPFGNLRVSVAYRSNCDFQVSGAGLGGLAGLAGKGLRSYGPVRSLAPLSSP
jgi:hypothetical protein